MFLLTGAISNMIRKMSLFAGAISNFIRLMYLFAGSTINIRHGISNKPVAK
jgi:hypothetical protein